MITLRAVAFLACVIASLIVVEHPVYSETTPPTATRDAATMFVNGESLATPVSALLVGAQASSGVGIRVRPLIACDRFFSKDFENVAAGAYGLAVADSNRNIHVCSYSISNGKTAQDVQFISGVEASAGNVHSCSGVPVSGKFHLTPNQFISQGSGVGSLFAADKGLCIKLSGAGDVSVNITYSSF